MIFSETGLPGAFVIELEPLGDERGFFARSFCEREFAARGLEAAVRQCNISFNIRRGTLRGLHFQEAPNEEAKLVRCTAGAIHDVIVDLRPHSPTYLKHFAIRLEARSPRMLFAPAGFAHGFLTLEDNAEVFYQMSQFYAPESARGIRWNDPALGIDWPLQPAVISQRDGSYPDWEGLA